MYLIAVAEHMVHRDQSFENHRPICVLRPFYQEVRQLRYRHVGLVRAVD